MRLAAIRRVIVTDGCPEQQEAKTLGLSLLRKPGIPLWYPSHFPAMGNRFGREPDPGWPRRSAQASHVQGPAGSDSPKPPERLRGPERGPRPDGNGPGRGPLAARTATRRAARAAAGRAGPGRSDPLGDLNPCCPVGPTPFYLIRAVPTALVDSNSTRTEPCVSIRPDPEAQVRLPRRRPRIATDANRSSVRAGRWGRV